MKPYIIAEAGVNHNGQLEKALALVDVAYNSGADAVKFQTFRTDELVARHAKKASYQERGTGRGRSQYEMLQQLEIDEADHFRLVEHCNDLDLDFLSSPFDLQSLSFLVDDLKLGTIKLGSGELTNGPLLQATARADVKTILSTGMGTLDLIQNALKVFVFGATESGHPTVEALDGAWSRRDDVLNERVMLLQCTTEYPTPIDEVNLRAMKTIQDAFGLPTGLSDHTSGISVCIAAAALDAAVIEKHITLDRALEGPDHAASLEPDEFAQMVTGVRAVSAAMGDGVKKIQPCEEKNILAARKSLVALRPISKGETFDEQNLGVKRPGTGLSPMEYWDLLGQPAQKSFVADEVIEL